MFFRIQQDDQCEQSNLYPSLEEIKKNYFQMLLKYFVGVYILFILLIHDVNQSY